MTRRAKAADPIIQREHAMEAVGLQVEAARLERQANIAVTRKGEARLDGKKVEHDIAKRQDAFDALRGTLCPGGYDAARRLERDMLMALLMGDHGRPMERVDEEGKKDFAHLLAGIKRDEVKARLSSRDWWLLLDLMVPTIQRASWRDHVAYITGETNANAQGAAVRGAVFNLTEAYKILDGVSQKAA